MDDNEIIQRKLLVAVQEACGALNDLARVLLQGPRDENEALRGGVAYGLRRAAALIDGKAIGMDPDPKHKDTRKAQSNASN